MFSACCGVGTGPPSADEILVPGDDVILSCGSSPVILGRRLELPPSSPFLRFRLLGWTVIVSLPRPALVHVLDIARQRLSLDDALGSPVSMGVFTSFSALGSDVLGSLVSIGSVVTQFSAPGSVGFALDRRLVRKALTVLFFYPETKNSWHNVVYHAEHCAFF